MFVIISLIHIEENNIYRVFHNAEATFVVGAIFVVEAIFVAGAMFVIGNIF